MVLFIKTHSLRLAKATSYSIAGLIAAFKTEPAFVLEILLCVILIPIACLLDVSMIAKAILISSLLLVLIVELMNSAIETVVDRISLEQHVLSKKAKDVGSAAVFVAIINVIVIWTLVLI